MATVVKVRRIANPRRRHNAKRRYSRPRDRKGHFVKAHKRRAPVIRRYSKSALKRELKRRGVRLNPNPRRKRRNYSKRVVRRHSNPVLLELGAVNPRRRRKSVAKANRRRRRASNPRRRHVRAHRVHHRRRRRNAVIHMHANPSRRRRYYGRRRHHRTYRRSRNPLGYGTKDLLMMGGGVLIGVAATKYIPSILPASVTSVLPLGSFTGVVITGASAFIAGWAAAKFMPVDLAKGVILGGVALTVSQLLNMFAPPAIASQLALSGVGDIVPTQGFVVPDRSMRPMLVAAPVAAKSGMGAFRGGGWRSRG